MSGGLSGRAAVGWGKAGRLNCGVKLGYYGAKQAGGG